MSAPDVTDLDFASAPPPRAPGGVNPRGRGRRAHAHDHVGEACANCGTILLGPHCHVCGQQAHVHRSLGHAFEEFLHGLLHLDGRTWRTLPKLFFRPGTLTRQYITGKRADHVPPMALFLFSVFAMFVVFAFSGGAIRYNEPAPLSVADATAALDKTNEALAEARAGLTRLEAAAPGPAPGAEGARSGAIAAVEGTILQLEATKAERERDLAAARAAESGAAVSDPPSDGLREALAEAMESGELTINTGSPELDKKIKHKLENPEFFLYKLQNTAYKFAFLLVPLTLPFLWLLFVWKRGVTLFDHIVFSLYSLSFVTILVTIEVLISNIGVAALSGAGGVLLAAVPAHMFFQLKGGYELSWLSAAWRLIALLLCLALVIGLFVFAIVALGALG